MKPSPTRDRGSRPEVPTSLDDRRTHEVLGLTMSEEPEIRALACTTLGERGVPATAAMIHGSFDDPDPAVRGAAIRAAGRVRGPGAHRFLARAAGDPDPGVAAAARKILDRWQEGFHAAPPPVREAPGPDEVTWLLDELRAPDPRRRQQALERLEHARDPRVGPVLAGALEDPAPKIRALSAAGLAVHPVPGTVKRLTELMEDPDPEVRRNVARAMGVLRTGLSILVGALGDDHAAVRIEATRALVRLGGDRVTGEIRQAAVSWVPGSPWLLEALVELDQDIRPVLEEWLDHPWEGVRGVAVDWIRFHRLRALRRSLERLRDDPEEWLRAEVEEALASLGS